MPDNAIKMPDNTAKMPNDAEKMPDDSDKMPNNADTKSKVLAALRIFHPPKNEFVSIFPFGDEMPASNNTSRTR